MTFNVLLFKAEAEENESDDPYISRILSLGVKAVLIPVIKFTYCNSEALKLHLTSPHSFNGIVFGSPRSVHAVEQFLPLDEEWARNKCYCVGEKTAKIAQKLQSWKIDGQHCGNGENLAKYIIESGEKGPLLIPQSNIARQTIAKILSQAGIQVVTIDVYITESNPDLPSILSSLLAQRDSPTCLIYFSPSGVNSTLPIFDQLSTSLSQFKIGAIGPTTSAYLEEKGFNVDFMAEKPTPEHLAEALSEVLP